MPGSSSISLLTVQDVDWSSACGNYQEVTKLSTIKAHSSAHKGVKNEKDTPLGMTQDQLKINLVFPLASPKMHAPMG